eukprot:2328348-Pyramimonas_sp.AAC.1
MRENARRMARNSGLGKLQHRFRFIETAARLVALPQVAMCRGDCLALRQGLLSRGALHPGCALRRPALRCP